MNEPTLESTIRDWENRYDSFVAQSNRRSILLELFIDMAEARELPSLERINRARAEIGMPELEELPTI